MKNKLTLLFTILLSASTLFAQQSKSAPPRPAPAPKGPPPYVLKKDYEPQMEELKSKVSAATNAAAAARNSVDAKFQKVVVLDSQMREVQNILSSASFQIAMNADSLKETRFSMEEFQKKTDDHFATIENNHASLSNMLWMLFGVCVALTIIVLVVVMMMMQKRITKLESFLRQNEEVMKKSLSLSIEKQQKDLTTELQSSESRMLVDVSTLKRELTNQLNKDRETTSASIESLAAKIDAIGRPQADNSESNAADPEVFI